MTNTGNTDQDWFEFYRKFVDLAIHDTAPNRQGIDMGMAQKLVQGSPKQAQLAIQQLWDTCKELRSQNNPAALDARLHCCSLAIAYMGVFGPDHPSTTMILRFSKGLSEEIESFAKERGLI